MKTATGKPLPITLFQERDVTYKEANTNQLSQMFCDRINPDRTAAGYKPLTVPRMNMLLQHLDLHDRKLFYGSLLEARNFGSAFFARLRV